MNDQEVLRLVQEAIYAVAEVAMYDDDRDAILSPLRAIQKLKEGE